MKCTYRAQIAAKAEFQSDDPLGDQIQKFNESIGIVHDSAEDALEQLKYWNKMMGREWDDTPVTEGYVVSTKGDVQKSQNVGLEDLNVEYAGMDHLNKAIAKNGR